MQNRVTIFLMALLLLLLLCLLLRVRLPPTPTRLGHEFTYTTRTDTDSDWVPGATTTESDAFLMMGGVMMKGLRYTVLCGGFLWSTEKKLKAMCRV